MSLRSSEHNVVNEQMQGGTVQNLFLLILSDRNFEAITFTLEGSEDSRLSDKSSTVKHGDHSGTSGISSNLL